MPNVVDKREVNSDVLYMHTQPPSPPVRHHVLSGVKAGGGRGERRGEKRRARGEELGDKQKVRLLVILH